MPDVAWVSIGVLMLALGFVFSIIPPLPGVVFAYASLWCCRFMEAPRISAIALAVATVVMVVAVVFDYVAPLIGAKLCGGTKWGFWGGIIGMIAGIFLLPIGMLFGYICGVFVGEYLKSKDWRVAGKAWLGSVTGFIGCAIVRIIVCLIYSAWFVFLLVK